VYFPGDEGLEGPEYLYNTAPFWVSLTVPSCGAGAVMYTEPVWLGATSDPYTPVQWDLLATTGAVAQALLIVPGALADRCAPRAAAPARLCFGGGVVSAGAYVAMANLLAAHWHDMRPRGVFARALACEAAAGLGAAALLVAALLSAGANARADAARATRREGYLVLGVPTFALVKNLRVTFSAHVRSRLRNKVVTLAAVSSYPHMGHVRAETGCALVAHAYGRER